MATKVLQVLGKLGSDYITPQMYGAKADGKHDDTAAVQAALDKGGVIYFPPGRYSVNKTLKAYTPGKITMCNPYPCRWNLNKTLNNSGDQTTDDGAIYIPIYMEPDNWRSFYIECYRKDNGTYYPLKAPAFKKNIYYSKITDNDYLLMSECPYDWYTNYKQYFIKNENNEYEAVTSLPAPIFEENKYYTKSKCGDYPKLGIDVYDGADFVRYGARIETHSQDGFGLIIGDGVEVDGLYIRAMEDFGPNINTVIYGDKTATYRCGGIVLQYDGTKGEACYPARTKFSNVIIENESWKLCPEVMFDYFPASEFGKVFDNITIGGQTGRTHCTYGFRAIVDARDGQPGRFENEDSYNWASSIRINNLLIDIHARDYFYINGGGKGCVNWTMENLAIQACKAFNYDEETQFPDAYTDIENRITEPYWISNSIITLKKMGSPTFIGAKIWDLHNIVAKNEIIKVYDDVTNLSCIGCAQEFNDVEMVLAKQLQNPNNLRIDNLVLYAEMEDDGNIKLNISDGYVNRYTYIPMLSEVTNSVAKGVKLNRLNLTEDSFLSKDALEYVYEITTKKDASGNIKLDEKTGVPETEVKVYPATKSEEYATDGRMIQIKGAEEVDFEAEVGEDTCFIGDIIDYIGPNMADYNVLLSRAPTWMGNTYYLESNDASIVSSDGVPRDWNDNFAAYFVKQGGEFVSAAISSDYHPEWAPNMYYQYTEGDGYELLESESAPDDWDSTYTQYYFQMPNKQNPNDPAYVPLVYRLPDTEFSNDFNYRVNYWYSCRHACDSLRTLNKDGVVVNFDKVLSPNAGTLIPVSSTTGGRNDLYCYIVSNLMKVDNGALLRFSNLKNGKQGFAIPYRIFCYDINKKFLESLSWTGGNALKLDVEGVEYIRVTIQKHCINDFMSWDNTNISKIFESKLMLTMNDPENFKYEEYSGTRFTSTLQPILVSPNGTKFSLAVDDTGNLITKDLNNAE